jgi:transcriptional regulator with XRE-family HTH domain
MVQCPQPVGDLLREWRQRRRLSQLELACEAEISTRHLSFVETGRAAPSREMVMNLAERLEVPLRDRNTLLLAAGFAPVYRERPLADPVLHAAREAIDLILSGQEPYPALAIDRHWTMVASNRAVPPMLTGISASLLEPPVNVLRLSLHPDGLARRIVNLSEWRSHLLDRLRRQIDVSRDPVLGALMNELRAYPHDAADTLETDAGVVVPLRLTTEAGVLSFFSTTMIFGTPVDITLAELAVELFFPADTSTMEVLRRPV